MQSECDDKVLVNKGNEFLAITLLINIHNEKISTLFN